MLGARGPDLLAVDDVAVGACGGARGLDPRRVGAGVGLGHGEGLQAQLAGGDPRQVLGASARRCRGAAGCPSMYICAWQAPALPPLAQISSRITLAAPSAEPRAAVLLRDQRRRASRARSAPRRTRRVAVGLERPPVGAGEAGAELRAPPRGCRRALVGDGEVHGSGPPVLEGLGEGAGDLGGAAPVGHEGALELDRRLAALVDPAGAQGDDADARVRARPRSSRISDSAQERLAVPFSLGTLSVSVIVRPMRLRRTSPTAKSSKYGPPCSIRRG